MKNRKNHLSSCVSCCEKQCMTVMRFGSQKQAHDSCQLNFLLAVCFFFQSTTYEHSVCQESLWEVCKIYNGIFFVHWSSTVKKNFPLTINYDSDSDARKCRHEKLHSVLDNKAQCTTIHYSLFIKSTPFIVELCKSRC